MKSTLISFEITLLVFFCGFLFNMNKDSYLTAAMNLGPGRYCGTDLVNILRSVCRGYYHSNGKRVQVKDFDESTEDLSNSYNSLDIPFQKGVPQWIKRATFVRKARNIVQECCERSCNYYDLISYCAPQ